MLAARLHALDVAGLRLARTRGHTPGAERAARAYSRLGQYAGLWLAIGAVGTTLDAERRVRWRRATATVAVAYVANQLIKVGVRRARPQLSGLPHLISNPTQLSFPSAHATSSFAAVQAFAGLLPGGVLRTLAGALALSRVYLGVHYPSDVLAGAALGTLIGRAAR